ncbi:hypothetical protein [Streptococcus pluranimalium]
MELLKMPYELTVCKSLVNYPKGVWTKTEIELATERAARQIANFIFER